MAADRGTLLAGLVALCQTVVAEVPAPECPCLTAASAKYASIQARLGELGYSPDYGLAGCKAYDNLTTQVLPECENASPKDPVVGYCFANWCYIDEDVCQVNSSRCARLGSSDGPFCRSRPNKHSQILLPLKAHYSYETCGFVDTFTRVEHPFSEMLGRRAIQVAPMREPGVSYYDSLARGWTGSMFELFKASLTPFQGVQLQVIHPRVSNASLGQFSSEWTACVNDVAIGRVDVCIGDFWVTNERVNMAAFFPQVAETYVYFAARERQGKTFSDVMAVPFKPITPRLWLCIVSFLILYSVLLLWAEAGHNDDDFPQDVWFRRLMNAVYLGLANFVSGPAHAPKTGGGKLMTLGASYFVLVALASYTANLASFLLAPTYHIGVQSLQDAIAQKYRFCGPSTLMTEVLKVYPQLRQAQTVDSDVCPRLLAMGEVDGLILDTSILHALRAARYVHRDCDSDTGPYRDDPVVCPQDDNGNLDVTRDCAIFPVGTSIWRLGISMPVAEHLHGPLTWAMEKVIGAGRRKTLQEQFYHQGDQAQNVCPSASSVDASASLDITSIAGAMGISVCCILIALCGACVQKLHKRAFVKT